MMNYLLFVLCLSRQDLSDVGRSTLIHRFDSELVAQISGCGRREWEKAPGVAVAPECLR